MKISQVVGTGVPAGAGSAEVGRSVSPDKIARAKAVASGQEVPQSQNDPQVERIQSNTKRIKMKTQVSTNRHEVFQETVPEETHQDPQNPTPDNNVDPKPEETRPLDPQVAAIIKAKRALQVKERELAKREEALKNPQAAPLTVGQEDLIAKLKANPLSVLQDAGVTYEQLTEAILANQSGTGPEIQNLRNELKSLKEEITGQLSERDKLAEQQVLNEIDREVIGLTAQDDKFEAIRVAKAQRQVTKLIHRIWQEGFPGGGPNGEDIPPGTVLDTAQAAEYVENQLLEDAQPFLKLKKFQKQQEPVSQTATAQSANTRVMRTLTNRDTAAPGPMDRRARALAAFAGTLKKG